MSGPHSRQSEEVLVLFKRFLAERWFGGPDFESWVREHVEHEAELRRLRDNWLAELRGPGSETPVPRELRGHVAGGLLPGDLVAGFRLVKRLGSGASGEVWEAEELALDRRVALKLLRPDLLLDDRAMERFRNEAFAGAHIHHPGVVTVYSMGREHGQPYIAMELVEGGLTLVGWLDKRRKEGGSVKEHCRRALTLALQVAEALSATHAAGVLHRDVKPGNILVTPDEQAKVADFGLARVRAEGGLSRTGDIMGTPAYMSPEQMRGEVHRLDGRTDVFSLGATLYELVTFRRAFQGETYEEIARAILLVDPPRLRSVDASIPRDLERVVAHALEKHRGDRYPGMRELAEDLARLLAGEPPMARSTTLAARLRKWTRRHPTLAVASAIALVAALAFLGYWRGHRRDVDERARAELFARAELAVEQGNLERAHALVEEADRYGKDDPTGWLILAASHSQNGQMPEAQQALDEARARGFLEDTTRLHSAVEHQAYAVFLQSRRDFAQYPEAEQHFRKALELDPERWRLQYSIYQLRVAVGDTAGACAALDALLPNLPEADPFRAIVEALRLEQEGDAQAAWAKLEALQSRPGLGPEGLAELRWTRHAGRLLTRLGEYQEAERYLRQAVEEAPDDCWSLDALTVLYFQQHQEHPEEPALRKRLLESADRATACSASLPTPHLVRAWALAYELDAMARDRRNGSGLPARIESELDALTEAPPALRAQAARVRAYLRYLQAETAFAVRDFAATLAMCREAAELDPAQWMARALGAQAAFWQEDPEAGLSFLDQASREPARVDTPGDRLARAKVFVWGLRHASSRGDDARFARARDALAAELEAGTPYSIEDLANAAEFLTLAPEAMRDCELGLALLERPAVLTFFEARQPDVLETIRESCW